MNIYEQLRHDTAQHDTRRQFLKHCVAGVGTSWLASMGLDAAATGASDDDKGLSHFAPKAKRVIFLHMAGAPSQLELFDHKPELTALNGKDCPKEFLEGQRFAFIQGVPKMLGYSS